MRLVKHILLFGLVFTAWYYGLYWALFTFPGPERPLIKSLQRELILDKDHFTSTIASFDPRQAHDILFLGSSHCFQSFDPRLFEKAGWKSFNLGSRSQTPLNSYYLLKHLEPDVKTIMLEMFPGNFYMNGKESFFHLNANTPNIGMLAELAMVLRDLRCWNLFSLKPFIDSYPARPQKQRVYKGYVWKEDSVGSPIRYYGYAYHEENMGTQLSYLQKIASLCRERGIRLILVYAPVPKPLVIQKESGLVERLERFAQSNEVAFYNYGRQHHLNDRYHFFDDDHLNQAGVSMFNNILIEALHRENRKSDI